MSIIGQLQHACSMVKPGRSFLRRMIDLSRGVRELHYKVCLNAGFRSDLKWWSCFLPVWNGKELMSSVTRSGPPVVITSDASGSWGCGAFTSTGEWFQLKLPETWSDIHITVKELLPIVLGVAVWGRAWRGYKVTCLCDNTAVVAIVNSGRSRMDRVMHLMRSLTFFLARWGVSLSCTYLPGVDNGAADALSRNNVSEAGTDRPQGAHSAARAPAVVPVARDSRLDGRGLDLLVQSMSRPSRLMPVVRDTFLGSACRLG